MLAFIAEVRKFLVAAIGLAGAVVTANVLPEQWAGWVSTGIAIATAVLTYVVPNVEQVFEELSDDDDDLSVQDVLDRLAADSQVPPWGSDLEEH